MTYLKPIFTAACAIYSSVAISGWDSAYPADAQQDATPVSLPRPAKTSTEPVTAATPAGTDFAPGIRIAQSIVNDGDPMKVVLTEAANATVGITQSTLRQYLPTFELNFRFSEGGKPLFGALAVIPLYESEDLVNTVFNQSSIFHQDGRTTVNLGLGYRRLVSDERVILGVNTFYDHEFPYEHARTSLGAEIRTSVAELNANVYHGASGWRTGRNGLQERGMGGFDVEAGVALPYLPQVKAYARRFEWNAIEGTADLKGNTFSVKGTAYRGITLEIGRDYYSGSTHPDSSFAMWQLDMVKLLDTSVDAEPFLSDQAYALKSMREHRFDKVRRENIIQKQGRGFTITASGR